MRCSQRMTTINHLQLKSSRCWGTSWLNNDADRQCNQSPKTVEYPKLLNPYDHNGLLFRRPGLLSATTNSPSFSLQVRNAFGTQFETRKPPKGKTDVRHDAPAIFLATYGEEFLYGCSKMLFMHTRLFAGNISTEISVVPTVWTNVNRCQGYTGTIA